MDILAPLLPAPPFVMQPGGVRNVTVMVRNESTTQLSSVISAINARAIGANISIVGDGGNMAPIYAPLFASLGVKYTPHLRYKAVYGGMLPYLHRLINSLLSGDSFPGLAIVVNPSYVIPATLPDVPAGYDIFGSFDTIMGLDTASLLTLTNTPSVYNYGRYAMANPLWDTPEKLLRVMGVRMGWNQSNIWA